jgi:hypothetical protein
MIDRELIDLLACPVSKESLEYNQQSEELICRQSGMAYPIRNGIPTLLVSEARKIGNAEKTELN